jgi:anti-anti-sigma factor
MTSPRYLRFHTEGADCLWVTPLDPTLDFRQPEAQEELAALDAELAQSSTSRVVVDLSLLPHFGSVVLEWLVSLWKKVRHSRGNLVIHRPSEIGREVLQVVKFDRIWPIVDSAEEALRLVRQDSSES